jgi:phosphoribosylaminoimidazolecarboxamide formyltransferase/IMP cyclohydrolase
VIGSLATHDGCLPLVLREELAAAAFALTARYDAAISAYMHARRPATETSRRFPPTLTLSYAKVDDLRYGENPHQAAALYRTMHPAGGPSVVGATQLHGKELSYNNVADAAAALDLVRALAGVAVRTRLGQAAACVVKHSNPCGASIAPTAADAVDEAILGDPLAAYGGIVGVSVEVDGPAAARLCRSDVFLEVVVAPSFSQAAVDQLTKRWANLRLLAVGPIEPPSESEIAVPTIRQTFVEGGLLSQERDARLATPAEIELKAGPPASERTLAIVSFMEAVCRGLTSNAVAVGGESKERPGTAVRLFGAGAGQMDRVAACKLCVKKAGELAKGAVVFSDAFFPFKDGPEVLIKAGVSTIAHPGGSKRDQETFDACAAANVTCLLTGLRHFRH